MEVGITFPKELVHADVSEAITDMLTAKYKWECETVSAGNWDVTRGVCSGKSDTLNLKSRGEEDERTIRLSDNNFHHL